MQASNATPVYYVEIPRPFISTLLPYMVMLRDMRKL